MMITKINNNENNNSIPKPKLRFFKMSKTLKRVNIMLENAISGIKSDEIYDEYTVSSIEVKMNRFLQIKQNESIQLQKQKQQVEQLISDISHQTKTPIANLMLYSSLLKEQPMSEDCSPLVNEIAHQSERLNFLVQTMVKTSQLESGLISVVPVKNNICDMISNTVAQILPKADVKGINITSKVSGINALFDMRWTSEALFNILDNAVKYTPISGAINIVTTAYESFCCIDITDNGIGIDENEHSKVFSRFYRSVSSNEQEGVGIGLYLSREIIEKQSGYIKLKSSVGNGSTFSIFLPIDQSLQT